MNATNNFRLWGWIFLTLLLGALAEVRSPAQPSDHPRSDFWNPLQQGDYPGAVSAAVVTNGVVYIGGAFQKLVRDLPAAGVVLDVNYGGRPLAYPEVDGFIFAVAPDGMGGWFIGGIFDAVAQVPVSNLAHIRSEMTVDRDWTPNPKGYVYALAVSEDTVFVGGSFTEIGGLPRRAIAALATSNAAVRDWDAQPHSSGETYIESMIVWNGIVFISGGFERIGGQPRHALAALDAVSALALDWSPQLEGTVLGGAVIVPGVWSMALLHNKVYFGGSFAAVNGQPRNSLAAVDARTGALLSWNPDATFKDFGTLVPSAITQLLVQCDTIYVLGGFVSVGGVSREFAAALDPETGRARPWDPKPDQPIQRLAATANTVFAVGLFENIGGQPRKNIAALDAVTGQALPWSLDLPDPFQAPRIWVSIPLAISGNRLFFGGNLSAAQQVPRSGLAALDTVTGLPTGWDPQADGHVNAMALSGDRLYVGGNFLRVSGQPRGLLAAVELETGKPTSWNPELYSLLKASEPDSTYNWIQSLAVTGNTVYASGISATDDPYRVIRYVAAVDANSGQVQWKTEADSNVESIVLHGETLYVGGSFLHIGGSLSDLTNDLGGFIFQGGELRNGLAALDATTGQVTAWQPGFVVSPFQLLDYQDRVWVSTLLISDDLLYVGGTFTVSEAPLRRDLVALNLVTDQISDWNPQVLQSDDIFWGIESMAKSSEALYVSGSFTNIGGQARNGLAAVDLMTGKATPWNPQASGGWMLGIVAASHDSVYYSGFINNPGQRRRTLAVFPPLGNPYLTREPRNQQVLFGETATFGVEAEGFEPLIYQWRLNGTNLVDATNAVLTMTGAQLTDSGIYSILVTNVIGRVSSAEATLVVVVPPKILDSPVSGTVVPGSNMILSVNATGNPAPVFQWRLNGMNIPGAVFPTLTLTNAQPTDSGSYNVLIANIGGTVSSQTAEIIVTSPVLPFADHLKDRITTISFSGVGSGHNTNATHESGEPSHAGKMGRKSVWYAWQAPTNGVARFSTRGSGFDTLLAVYANTAVAGNVEMADLREVAADDDRGGFHTSEVVFNAAAGTEYLIAIDGFGRASGSIVLSWSLDPNIAEVPHIFQQPVSQTVAPGADVAFSVFAASAQPLFYQWVFNCELIPDATNAVLAVTNVQPAKVGSYSVRVSNSPDWPGDGSPGQCPACLTSLRAFLEIGPDAKVLSQDKLGDVTAVSTRPSRQSVPLHGQSVIGSVFPGILGTQILNNFGATTEQGEPNHAGVIGGASRWQALTPAADGLLQVDTLGSKVDTVLAVYTGTDLLDLQLVAEDNNSGLDGFTSVVRFPAKRGTNYLVAADAVNAAQGEIHLNWGLGSPPASSQAPTNRVARLGETIALLTEATGMPAPSLQWRWNGLPLAGRTNATLTLTNFQAAQAGTYSVVASNFLGMLTNEIATLTLAESLRLHSAAFLTNGAFRLLLSGDLGPKTVVQASSNLLNWLPIFTNLAPAAPIEFIDSAASNHALRFYRAVK